MLTGTSEPGESAAVLRRNGARVVVLKLSRKGCAVFAGGEASYMPAFRVSVVDTTGAGDCFVAGFLAALDRGLPLQEAARFANAVGALTVQQDRFGRGRADVGRNRGVDARGRGQRVTRRPYSRSSSCPYTRMK